MSSEDDFRDDVNEAIQTVRTILDLTRTPKLLEDHQDHTYNDKYALAEILVNTAISALLNILHRLGLTDDKLREIHPWVHRDNKAVTLCFQATETCEFVGEQSVEIVQSEGVIQVDTIRENEYEEELEQEDQIDEQNQNTGGGLFSSGGRQASSRSSERKSKSKSKSKVSSSGQVKKKHKISTFVKQYHWKLTVTYRLFCYAGTDKSTAVVLAERTADCIIVKRGTPKPPFPGTNHIKPIQCPLTWVLQNLETRATPTDASDMTDGDDPSDTLRCCFHIDRTKDSCRTPSRNKDTVDAMQSFRTIADELMSISTYLVFLQGKSNSDSNAALNQEQTSAQQTGKDLMGSIDEDGVFVPVLPLMIESSSSSGTASSSATLPSVVDVDSFLNKQCGSMDKQIADIDNIQSSAQHQHQLISSAEAKMVLLTRCVEVVANRLELAIDYIEDLLRKQLIAAIGKVVQPKDFEEFISFHNQKLFATGCAPKPFCFAIRRPGFFPNGLLTIEKQDSTPVSTRGRSRLDDTDTDAQLQPIETFVRTIHDDNPVSVPLNAACAVSLTGPKYLHGWMLHKFESAQDHRFKLAARARQFSAFILMVGKMGGPDRFVPKDAIIVQNKDEVFIPLLLEEIPSAKEFKDAIASLSPEQQRFAKSFRGMQLESSVFGVAIVQIKPQLEALLGLPDNSLTKQIQLTQQLMSLFIDYQIPSDLLSFDGPADATQQAKLLVVQGHVKSVMDVVDDAKKKELEGIQMETARREALRAADVAVAQNCSFELFASMRGGGGSSPGAIQRMPASVRHRRSKMSGGAAPDRRKQQEQATNSSPVPSKPLQLATKACRKSAPSVPQSDTTNTTPPQQGSMEEDTSAGPEESATSRSLVDFTAIPNTLDSKFEKYSGTGSIRSTIIKTDNNNWDRTRKDGLLGPPTHSKLQGLEIRAEKNKAFDLLDALSRSGSLAIAASELHVVVAVSHCFEKSVMGTVIMDNVNPIEQVERSSLMVASTIHGTAMPQLVGRAQDRERLYPTAAAADGGTQNPPAIEDEQPAEVREGDNAGDDAWMQV